MKIRGKKLTFSQRNILMNNNINNTDDYLYVKMETICDDGDKHLKQNIGKIQRMVIVNRETGEIKKVNVGGVYHE